ncbi:hypothetical protein C8J56DRAFT_409439 [Mycena floridula]|nr:hypothetical protein C8J56DRAFT_409439 [Mycena floridula]
MLRPKNLISLTKDRLGLLLVAILRILSSPKAALGLLLAEIRHTEALYHFNVILMYSGLCPMARFPFWGDSNEVQKLVLPWLVLQHRGA